MPVSKSATRGRQAKPANSALHQGQAADYDASKATESRWTFFTNHTHVLIVLHEDPTLVLREVASRVGITERAVQRIVQELEEGGFLQRERIGRRNQYTILTEQHLRHPVESHCTLNTLLKLIDQHRPQE